jgi:MFS family permease
MAAAYAAVVPLLEIPSGILADRWSRRGVLMIGNAGAFLSVLIGGLSGNVAAYLVAALLLGVYFAMQSGTFDAIVYDTVLEETGESERFESIVGRVRMVESASLVLGALGGGALAAITAPRATYFATLPFLVIASACLLRFREPRLHAPSDERSLRRHVAMTFGVIRRERQLLPVVALLVLTSILTQAVFEFGPLWLTESGTGAGAFGPAWAGLMASLGLGGALAGRVRFESSRTLTLVIALLLAGASTLLVTTHAVVATGAQIIVALLSVALGIFLTRLLHDSVPSDVRSSVASGVGAATWGAFLPFALGFGAVTEHWGVQAAGGLLVLIVLAIAGLVLPVARRAAAAERIPVPLVPVSAPLAA